MAYGGGTPIDWEHREQTTGETVGATNLIIIRNRFQPLMLAIIRDISIQGCLFISLSDIPVADWCILDRPQQRSAIEAITTLDSPQVNKTRW